MSGAGDWDRYYDARVGLEPLLGTPGVPQAAFGEAVATADGLFTQGAEHGFFLLAEEPVAGDPFQVNAALAGVPMPAGLPTIAGSHRRRVRHTATGEHVHVEQLVRGARLIGADARLHQDEGGVFAITGRPLGDVAARDPGPAPVAVTHEAVETCAERFDLDDAMQAVRIDQVVFPEGETATWAYEIGFVVPEHCADVRVYLRADNLSLLLSYNISSAAAATPAARVYPVNPRRTPDLVDVTIEGLETPGQILRGRAIDITQASGARFDRGGGDFAVDPGDPAFDEVQGYHHLWQATQYFARIADPGMLDARPFTPMRVHVNDPQAVNNAYYMPSTGELRFGTFFGTRSSARSASIVFHEFGHAISDSVCALGQAPRRNTESRGLSEGYSDYFAASWLDSPVLGDYVADSDEGARNCSNPELRFSPDFAGEEHDTGAVWAAVLWSLRERVGAETTDRLVIESLEFLGPMSTFDDAQVALRAVDSKLFSGANAAEIEAAYAARVT